MSYLVAVPEYVAAAATDLANLGSTISEATASAAGPTSSLLAAGADEVSQAVASVFTGHAQSFQALSVQAEAFHQQFVHVLTASGNSYTSAEAASTSLFQTVQQDVQAAINAPVQTLLGSTPIGGLTNLLPSGPTGFLPGGLTNLLPGGLTSPNLGGLTALLPGGLTSPNLAGLTSLLPGGLTSLNLGGLTNLLPGGLTSPNLAGLTSLLPGGLTSLLPGNLTSLLPGGLTNLNANALSSSLSGGLANLTPGGLANLTPGGLTNMVDGTLNTIFPGGINVGGFNLLNLANVPYDLFANVVNIPYYESLALQEFAYALGPAGQIGGVPGWIPPGATTMNGGVVGNQYALGGTGSWWMESMGNTWGWDNGNWPQVDAIFHLILPFQFTESLAEQFQTFAQAEFIDGSFLNTEFLGTNPLAYLGNWLHGTTPLSQLLAGTTFPTVQTDTIGQNVGNIINVGPPGHEQTAIWSGEPAQLQPLAPLQALGANLTESPSANPIMLPNLTTTFQSAVQFGNDVANDFNPFATGSFLYWGAPYDYSIPSVIGGTIQNATGIPNQFPLANFGAEPISGYSAGPASLLTGIPEGAQFLGQGLLGYLNPGIYAQAVANDIAALTNPAVLLSQVPLIGYLGIDP